MIYETDISESNEASQFITANMGGTTLNISLKWDTTWEEESNNLAKLLYNRAMSLPLMTSDGTIIRDYDYLLYFSTVPSTVDGMEEFLETADALPQKVRMLPEYQRASAMLEEQAFWEEVNDLAALYEEQLGWQATVERGGEIVVCTIRDGGWNYFDDNTAFRFVSSKAAENIGKDDLQYVMMEYDDGL